MTNVIAHRGASAAYPENTIAAFAGAVAMGADGIELDVRRTRDGAGAVHHDADLADGRVIVDLDAADLPVEVPLLAAALAACGTLEVNVEIKNWTADVDFDPARRLAPLVVDAVAAAEMTSRVVVSCFDLATIDRVHELAPDLRTAWLVVDNGDRLGLVDRAAARGHAGIHPISTMVDAAFVDAARAAGLFVNAWTVDDPEQIRRLAGLGVDGIVTNVPDVARAALGR